MRRRVSILFLWFATLLWIATTIVPHHHHNGILVFGLNLAHVNSQEEYCCNSEDENCCNSNDCEECPFLKGNDSIIKTRYDISNEKIKFSFDEYFYIEDYKYSFTYTYGVSLYSNYQLIKTILPFKDKQLRAPPFA